MFVLNDTVESERSFKNKQWRLKTYDRTIIINKQGTWYTPQYNEDESKL